jgi:hypothetical protein
VDFLIFEQKPSHLHYYSKIMSETKLPYAAFRSATKNPKRFEISPKLWNGNFTRIVGGTAMFKTGEWYKAAGKIIDNYTAIAEKGNSDGYDSHAFGAYREYDEVMFYRICKAAGLKTPSKRHCFVDGKKFNTSYRDIHLGDFKFYKRSVNMSKMVRICRGKNLRRFCELEKDPDWQWVSEQCCKDAHIRKVMRRLRRHMRKRKIKCS